MGYDWIDDFLLRKRSVTKGFSACLELGTVSYWRKDVCRSVS